MGHSKKHKKEKKQKKDKKKKRSKSSSSESEEEEEWVEKDQVNKGNKKTETVENKNEENKRDDWMSMDFDFLSSGTKREKKQKEKKEDSKEPNLLDKPGQSSRELNPYWKAGGTGMPSEEKPTEVKLPDSGVGDHGAKWLKKAYERAKEQAEEEGRSLEEVVSERWGSLERLQNLLKGAEQKESNQNFQSFSRGRGRGNLNNRFQNKDSRPQFKRPQSPQPNFNRNQSYGSNSHQREDRRSPYERNRDRDSNYRRPERRGSPHSRNSNRSPPRNRDKRSSPDSRSEDKRDSKNPRYRRRSSSRSSTDSSPDNRKRERSKSPHSRRQNKSRSRSSDSSSSSGSPDPRKKEISNSSSRDRRSPYSRTNYRNNSEKRGNSSSSERFERSEYVQRNKIKSFHKPDDDDFERSTANSYNRERYTSSSSSSKGWRKPGVEPKKETSPDKKTQPDSSNRINQKDTEETTNKKEDDADDRVLTRDEMNKIGAEMIKAEIMGKTELAANLKAKLEAARTRNESSSANQKRDKQIVTLTETDSKGFTRPFKKGDDQGPSRKRKIATHEDKKRVRYFADDDKYSLQDMFENEKFNSVADQNATFAKLMGREMSRKDGSLALDDPFEETAATDNSARENKNKLNSAIRKQIAKEKAYDECRWCLTSLNVRQDTIVTTRNKIYLCVPPFQSLTEFHCLIVPNYHVPCATQLDEDVWDEIMEFRKELVSIFQKEEEDIIFFEHASNFHRHPHMVLHCVPVPKEIGDDAAIYFKKAILECETEWSNNKKVVELAGRNVRRAVPKGLPYFAVDFGMQSGYAHVIEDVKLFPRNFAQEIIGGMMDLDHGIWRKQRNETEDNVKNKRDKLYKLICEK